MKSTESALRAKIQKIRLHLEIKREIGIALVYVASSRYWGPQIANAAREPDSECLTIQGCPVGTVIF